ncbi:hypothetical protein [Acaryochloris marina]|uniref:hypothetical protein n=1 Tax=Acaryochloris marina TaxID=155978 RepID=UPI0021C35C06|nr:hypothetical protein [Acaryochloris marina]BDM83169.1 hypothetical protein AM10699_60300 [Acaryochloris marina MBIC10699]
MLTVNSSQVTTEPVDDRQQPQISKATPELVKEVYQQQYRETYAELAITVQQSLGFPVLGTFEALFQLGCREPEKSKLIDQGVAEHPLLKDWPMGQEDCIGLISQGPYVQSQLNYHGVAVGDMMQYVCELFRDRTVELAEVSDA